MTVADDDLQRTIARTCAAHSELAQTIAVRPSHTVRPSQPAARNDPRQVLDRLLSRAALRTYGSELRIGELLGDGGMGMVHLATQRSLGRQVAVKALRPEYRKDAIILKLLQEAWITGLLEHPNIMPVYDIGLDTDGSPLIVLKRIEGQDWGDLMHDAQRVRTRLGEDDLLEWNLRVLMQVCSAVRFANRKGIVHRDLKPANVMIGELGEVYVVDWGIAVSLHDDGSDRLPLAADAVELAGTPAYMAPEMLGGEHGRLTECTDIYLLGAILFEIISGHPPHGGSTFEEIIANVVRSRPELPPQAPPELAAIVRRAMDPDPAGRFENAEQMRLAIQSYLTHSGSRRLAHQAQQRLSRLLQDLTAPHAAEAEQRRALYNLYGECRFGFRQALDSWRENPLARDGLLQATRAMVDYELGRGDAAAAALLAAELEQPAPELQRRVERAVAEAEKERRRVESLASQLDLRTGGKSRAAGAAALGAVWTLSPLIAPKLLDNPLPTSHVPSVSITVGLLLMVLFGGWLQRRTLMATVVNRRVWAAAALAMVAQLLLHGAAALSGMPLTNTVMLWPFAWFCVSAMLVITVDRRLLPMTLGFVVTLLIASRWPELGYYAMAGSNLLMTINLVMVWTPWRAR